MRCTATSTAKFFSIPGSRHLVVAAALIGLVPAASPAPTQINGEIARANDGAVDALNALGDAYAKGEGVSQDLPTAFRFYFKAAEQGFAPAQYNLALAYELGRGVKKDEVLAQKWYRAAAEQGHAEARHNLAVMLEEGRGSPADAVAAVQFYRAAAEQGFVPAQTNLGLLLAEGRKNLPANLIEAYAWLTISVENGANPAARDIVGQKLDAAQLAAANERIAKLQAQLAPPAKGSPTTATSDSQKTGNAPMMSKAEADETELAALRAEHVRLTESVRVLTADKTATEQKLAEAAATRQAGVDAAKRAEIEGRQLAEAQAELAKQKQIRTELEQANARLSSENQRLTTQSPVSEKAHPETGGAGAKESPDRDATIKKLLVDADAMKLELQKSRDQVHSLEARADDDRTTSARELADLTGQLERVQEANRALTEANHALLGTKSADEAAVKADIDRLSAQAQAAVAESEKLRQEQEAFKKQIAELMQERERSLVQLQEAEKARTELPALRQKLADAQKVRPEQEASIAELKSLNEKLSGDKAALQVQLADAGKAVEQAKAAADESKKRLASDERATAQGATTASELTKANEKLQGEIRDLNTQLETLRAENGRLSRTSADAEAMRTELAATREKLTGAEKSTEQSRGSLAELTAANEKLTGEAVALRKQLADAAVLPEQAKANEKFQGEIRDLNTQLETLRAENGRLGRTSADAEAMRTELAATHEKLTAAEKSAEQSRGSLADLTAANEKLAGEAVALRKQIADATAQSAAMRVDSDRLAQAEQKAADLASATIELSAARNDLTNLRAENTRLNERLQSLDRDRAARIAQLQQENAATSVRLRQAQSTLDQIAAAARTINGSASVTPGASPLARTVAPAEAAPAPGRVYTVLEGDSLARISVRYYGTSNRWQEIYNANRDLLKGANALRPGQQLKIP